MEIRINLLGDLGEAVRRSMSDEGYDVAPIEDDDHKMLVVWNKVRRYDIEPQPRQVLKAQGFDPQGQEPAIENLENVILKGGPLNIYLPKRVADITARDGLLDHWDIYHLHPGTEIDQRSGLIRRTEHILLCRFDDYRAYLPEFGIRDAPQRKNGYSFR